MTSTAAQFLSSYHWTTDQDGFGGYSGIALDPDGVTFVLLSDRAHLIEGSIFRHDGRIIGVRSNEPQPLDYPEDLFEKPSERDTEGLARDSAGRLYVSIESDNRIIRREADGSWSALPAFGPIDALPLNRGLEALAIGPDDTLYTLPEASANLRDPFAVFRYRASDGWDQPISITRSQGFVPVGADVGPDGRLYVLERGFSGFGFASRVRRFDPDAEGLLTGETLLTTSPRRHDNLEGLAVWQADDGALRMTMVSDDNFRSFQRTEIVEYVIGI